MENSSFSGFSTGYDAETTQQLLAEFWILADCPPFLPDLNLLDFSICSLLQAKVQAKPYTNLATLSFHCRGKGRASGGTEYIHKTCCSFRH
jgi:hypothetical protein